MSVLDVVPRAPGREGADVVRAEWTKLRSTRATGVCAVLAVVLSAGVTGLIGAAMGQREAFCARPGEDCTNAALLPDATVATAGVLGDGVPGVGLTVLMLLGAWVLLAEVRHRTLGVTFFVTPQRWKVLAAKAVVVAAGAFVVATVATVVSGVVFEALGGLAAGRVEPLSAASLGVALRTGLVVAVAAVAALAVAAVFRNLVVPVAVVLLWPTVVEVLVPSLAPQAADRVAGLMPFVNARAFVGLQDGASPPWGPTGSGLYFLAVALVLLVVAAVVLQRSDVRSR